jgi:outer membrane protein OmpU
MKKVLFATTALVATAGVASADISLSGSAEMGILGGNAYASTAAGANSEVQRETQFHTDIDVTFSMSGTTDAGLEFGASIDLDESQGANAFTATTQGGETIYLKGAFGTLTMGDTDGALDARTAEAPNGSGSLNDLGETFAHGANAGLDGEHDGQIARYDTPSLGGLVASISHEIDDTGSRDPVTGFGLSYAAGNVNFGIGYQSGEEVAGTDATAIAFSGGVTLGAATIGALYVEEDRDDWAVAQEDLSVGVTYTVGAYTFGGQVGQTSNVAGISNLDVSSVGITGGYDLGGGAKLLAGYRNTELDVLNAATIGVNEWDLGLSFSF